MYYTICRLLLFLIWQFLPGDMNNQIAQQVHHFGGCSKTYSIKLQLLIQTQSRMRWVRLEAQNNAMIIKWSIILLLFEVFLSASNFHTL